MKDQRDSKYWKRTMIKTLEKFRGKRRSYNPPKGNFIYDLIIEPIAENLAILHGKINDFEIVRDSVIASLSYIPPARGEYVVIKGTVKL